MVINFALALCYDLGWFCCLLLISTSPAVWRFCITYVATAKVVTHILYCFVNENELLLRLFGYFFQREKTLNLLAIDRALLIISTFY